MTNTRGYASRKVIPFQAPPETKLLKGFGKHLSKLPAPLTLIPPHHLSALITGSLSGLLLLCNLQPSFTISKHLSQYPLTLVTLSIPSGTLHSPSRTLSSDLFFNWQLRLHEQSGNSGSDSSSSDVGVDVDVELDEPLLGAEAEAEAEAAAGASAVHHNLHLETKKNIYTKKNHFQNLLL